MAVDEEHAEPTAPFERQHGPEQDRAVPAEDDRELAGIEDSLDGVRQFRRPFCDRASVERPGLRVAVEAVRRRLQTGGVSRVQAITKPVAKKLTGNLLTPLGFRPRFEGASMTA